MADWRSFVAHPLVDFQLRALQRFTTEVLLILCLCILEQIIELVDGEDGLPVLHRDRQVAVIAGGNRGGFHQTRTGKGTQKITACAADVLDFIVAVHEEAQHFRGCDLTAVRIGAVPMCVGGHCRGPQLGQGIGALCGDVGGAPADGPVAVIVHHRRFQFAVSVCHGVGRDDRRRGDWRAGAGFGAEVAIGNGDILQLEPRPGEQRGAVLILFSQLQAFVLYRCVADGAAVRLFGFALRDRGTRCELYFRVVRVISGFGVRRRNGFDFERDVLHQPIPVGRAHFHLTEEVIAQIQTLVQRRAGDSVFQADVQLRQINHTVRASGQRRVSDQLLGVRPVRVVYDMVQVEGDVLYGRFRPRNQLFQRHILSETCHIAQDNDIIIA